jgi:hypothetical protein
MRINPSTLNRPASPEGYRHAMPGANAALAHSPAAKSIGPLKRVGSEWNANEKLKTPRNPAQAEAPDNPVGRSLAGLLMDVRLALALTDEPGRFHCHVACALSVSNPGVRILLRSLA